MKPLENFKMGFVCYICRRQIVASRDLSRHMAAMHHNNRRRERCEKCSYSTDRVSDLRKHLDRRHGVREEKTSGRDRRWRNERPWRGQHRQEEHWAHRRTEKKNEDVPAPSTVEPVIETRIPSIDKRRCVQFPMRLQRLQFSIQTTMTSWKSIHRRPHHS